MMKVSARAHGQQVSLSWFNVCLLVQVKLCQSYRSFPHFQQTGERVRHLPEVSYFGTELSHQTCRQGWFGGSC